MVSMKKPFLDYFFATLSFLALAATLAYAVHAAMTASDTPTITAEQRATWFKAVAQWNATGAPLQQKLQQTQAAMKATCEKNPAYTLGDGKDGDPECVAKPKPPAEKKK